MALPLAYPGPMLMEKTGGGQDEIDNCIDRGHLVYSSILSIHSQILKIPIKLDFKF
jgi:hypothetical protein